MADEAPPPAAPATPTTPPAAGAPVIVALPRAEYDRLVAEQAAAATYRQQEAERAAAAENAKLKAIADKEGAEAALKLAKEQEAARVKERDDQINALRGRYAGEKKAATLAGLAAAVPWASPEAARAGLAALGDRFEAVEQPDGSYAVREKGTLRPAESAVPELLKLPDFSFYQAAAGGGGAGARNSQVTPGQPAGDMVAPANPGQEAFARYLTEVNAQRQAGYGAMGIPGLPGALRPGVTPAPNVNPFQPAGRTDRN